MNRIRKSLASLLLVIISASLPFSSNATADTGHMISQKDRKEEEKCVETQESAFSIMPYRLTSFIVAGTAGIAVFTALISYWYAARQHHEANDGAPNPGIVVAGAVVQAALLGGHDGPADDGWMAEEIHTLLQQTAPAVEISVQRELSENDVQTQATTKEVEVTKARAGRKIPRSQQLLNEAQYFLGKNDYTGPRTTRNRKEGKK